MKGTYYSKQDFNSWQVADKTRSGGMKWRMRWGFWVGRHPKDTDYNKHVLVVGPGESRGLVFTEGGSTVRVLIGPEGMSAALEAIILEGNYER